MNEAILSAALSTYSSLYGSKLFEVAQLEGSLTGLYKLWTTSPICVTESVSRLLTRSWCKESLQEVELRLTKNSITTVLSTSSDYPIWLTHTNDKPYVLYIKGSLDRYSQGVPLACVGNRRMSLYAKRAVGDLISGLSRYPICLISGLAFGVDAEVHRTAIDQRMSTVAVLAGGLDRYEPVSNSYLAERIMVHDALVSEYPPGIRPLKHHFLERNRIIAGMAKATILIEGGEHSGSLVTARYALNYGREVGAVPGDIFSPGSCAPHRLLRDGAWPIVSSQDILAILDVPLLPPVHNEPDGPIYQLLAERPHSIDSLHHALGLPVTEIQAEITLLELKNVIAVSSVGEYYLKG